METSCIVYFHAEDSLSFKWFRTKTHRENQELGNCLLFHSLNKSGFLPFSQCTQEFAVTDELATVCETILSCRLFLRHVGLTPIMPCELTSPWVNENDQNQIQWPAVFVKTLVCWEYPFSIFDEREFAVGKKIILLLTWSKTCFM